MTIFGPGDTVDTFEVGPGDTVDTFEVGPGEIVFIPPAYFHYIENIDDNDDDVQFAIFSIMNDQKILVFQGLLVAIQMNKMDNLRVIISIII